MALSLLPLLCRHTQLTALGPESVRWAEELTVQTVKHSICLYVPSAYKHMLHECRVEILMFWLPWMSLPFPPLHSGFFCVTSPGLNYIFMGQVDEEGRGKIAPQHFVMAFKTKNQKGLSVLKNKRCWAPVALRTGAPEAQLWMETIKQSSTTT